MTEITPEEIRSVSLLNEMGDTTLVWEPSADDTMIPAIQRLMDKGVRFFIVEPRAFGLLPAKKTQVTDAKEVIQHRALTVLDEDLGKMLGDGSISAVQSPQGPVTTVKASKDAKEVAKSHSVGVKPLKGG